MRLTRRGDPVSLGAVLLATGGYLAIADPAIPVVAAAFCLVWRLGLAIIERT